MGARTQWVAVAPGDSNGTDRTVHIQVEDGVLVAEGAIAFVKHARTKPNGAFAVDFDFMQVHFRSKSSHDAMAGSS